MKTKYQIFISSTYEDLKPERDVAIKAILELGHIPVGMEMFSAADEQQWELIKRQIDDSDYYVVIVAHRYGSMDAGVSYTEKEYDYAVSTKVPVLGFVIHDSAKWSAELMDDDVDKRIALSKFKEKVKSKPVNFWNTADDLHAKISISVAKAITAYPRPGWVRSTPIVDPEVTNELSRLSRENSDLRSMVDSKLAEKNAEEKEKQEIRRIRALLEGYQVNVSIRYDDGNGFTRVGQTTLAKVFDYFGPQLLVESEVKFLSGYLGQMLRILGDPSKKIARNWPVPQNRVKEWIAYFVALGLIAPSDRAHAADDTAEYWTLTPKGRKVHSENLIALLERNVPSETSDQSENEASR